MFSGDGSENGPEARYAALGFWKTDLSVVDARVRKNPQSYGFEDDQPMLGARGRANTYYVEHFMAITSD